MAWEENPTGALRRDPAASALPFVISGLVLAVGVGLFLGPAASLPVRLAGVPGIDKVAHFAWGLALTASLTWALARRARGAALAAGIVGSATLLLEGLQLAVPGRSVEAGDVSAGIAGAILAAFGSRVTMERWRGG